MHMNNHNETYEELSLISNTEDSLWKYVSCEKCDEKFENELDLKKHYESIHVHIETFKCKECKYHTTCLQEHTNDFHPKNLYGKRIRQNLKPSDLEEDSEDDYVPSETEEIETNQRKQLRKVKKVTEQARKKSKVDYVCDKCQNSFSRKDSLNRHVRNYCKN